MKLPELHLPDFSEFDIRAIPGFIKDHIIPFIIGIVVIVGAIVGIVVYKNHQAKEAALAAANVDWSIQALTLDQLQGGNYYVKDGDIYYKVAPGLAASTGEPTSIPSIADPENRMVMFGPDDEQIPTLYKDTQLIYKSSDFNNPDADGNVVQTPTNYYLERYQDNGYSVGICRLANPDGSKYRTTVEQTHFYPGCSALQVMKLKENAELVIDKINGVPLTANNVSPCGSITGLTHNAPYTVDAYIGTSPVGGQVVADTHMFSSFELYNLKDFELNSSGYAVIKMPEDMWSGYYYINGMGLFRYVNGYKAYGVSVDIDYNMPYYMGKDQAGNLITNPAPVTTDPTMISPTGTVPVASQQEGDPFSYKYKITIDNQQKSMTISIDYSEAMTYSDKDGDGTYDILRASDGVLVPGSSVPSATLTSPSGRVYEMTDVGAVENTMPSTPAGTLVTGDMNIDPAQPTEKELQQSQFSNTLSAIIDNPELGTWTVDLKGFYGRAFTVNTNYSGTSTNMVVKDSSNPTSMIVYLPERVADAVFKFTWDELGHTGVFTVKGPNNKEITSNARDGVEYRYPGDVLNEEYGKVDLHIGEAVAGEYTINITGDSLGHVYWNFIDLSYGNNDVSAEEVTDQAIDGDGQDQGQGQAAPAQEEEEETGTEEPQVEGEIFFPGEK